MSYLKRLVCPLLKAADDTATETAETQAYVKQKFRLQMVSLAISFAYLIYMGIHGGLQLDAIVKPWANGNQWLELFGVAGLFSVIAEAITFPIDFYSGFVVEHKFGLSTQTFGAYMWKWFKMNGLMLVFGAALLAGLYFLLWHFTAYWWLLATAGMLFISVVIGKLMPVLLVPIFYKVTPVEDQSLVDRLKAIAQGTGLTVSNVSRFSMSKETKKANAFLSGMGSTKHVMLGDTLVDAFTPEEIDAVFAHEVGHYVHGHIVKGIVMSTVVTLLSFFVCNLVLTSLAPALGYASFTAPAALPLFFLVLGVFSFLIGPFEKAVSRYFERQSDWYSLERMKNVPAHKAAFKRLAELNKAELKPAKWKVVLFHTHPPINERLAMADRFAELNK